jgi:hypothetical protein
VTWYIYVTAVVVWDISTASILTIPLHKILCNVSTSEHMYTLPNDFMVSYESGEAMLYTSHISETVCGRLARMSNEVFICSHDVMRHASYEIYALPAVGTLLKPPTIYTDTGAWIHIRRFSRVSNLAPIEFIGSQEDIFVRPSESNPLFFRMYNPTTIEISSISVYFVYPNEASVYINKIQRLRFDQISIQSLETIELPVSFHIDDAFECADVSSDDTLYISYVMSVQK